MYLSIYFSTYKNSEFQEFNKIVREKIEKYLPEFVENKYIVGKYRVIVRALQINFNVTLKILFAMNAVRKKCRGK